MGAGHLRDRLADHFARHRIYRGLSDGHGQAFAGDRADPVPGPERHPGTGRSFGNIDRNHRKMGDIRIVAGVLDDRGKGAGIGPSFTGKGKGRRFPLGQGDLHGIGKRAGQQRGIGGLGGRRRAGAGGPAAP